MTKLYNPQKHQIGDIVSFTDPGHSGRYAQIVGHKMGWKNQVREGSYRFGIPHSDGEPHDQPLWLVRYIDPQTGKQMVCPDSRCDSSKNESKGCVICSRYNWGSDIKKFADRDIEFYITEGMIDRSILTIA